MRLALALTVLIATLAVNDLAAQSSTRTVAVDTVPATLNAFLRARGDTLWFTVFAEHRRGATEDSAVVVVFHGSDAAMLTGGRKVPLPPSMARIYRGFHAEALECPQPATGCQMDSQLMQRLSRR